MRSGFSVLANLEKRKQRKTKQKWHSNVKDFTSLWADEKKKRDLDWAPIANKAVVYISPPFRVLLSVKYDFGSVLLHTPCVRSCLTILPKRYREAIKRRRIHLFVWENQFEKWQLYIVWFLTDTEPSLYAQVDVSPVGVYPPNPFPYNSPQNFPVKFCFSNLKEKIQFIMIWWWAYVKLITLWAHELLGFHQL